MPATADDHRARSGHKGLLRSTTWVYDRPGVGAARLDLAGRGAGLDRR
jgi:hypothetical protein